MTEDRATRSPFPGMDPWLEARWGEVHTALIWFARRELRPQLPAGLKTRIEEYVSLHLANGEPQHAKPDLRVVEREPAGPAAGGAAVVEAEPVAVPRVLEPETLRVLKVVDTRHGDRVVTTIEFLSPANKSFAGAEEFRTKQESLLRGGVNLVEVDLLRGGHYALSAPMESVPGNYREPYRACVVEASSPETAHLYHFSLRGRLPAIRIPFRDGDPPARLDLQALVDGAYAEGEYWDIDYTRQPDPPLDPEDAAWADELLRAAEKRS